MTAGTLADLRCINHNEREAIARCPSCERFFCDECITEHDGRMICNECLAEQLQQNTEEQSKTGASWLTWPAAFAGTFFLWLLFYLLGRILLAIPHSFHENMVF